MSEKFQNKYRVPSARIQNWDYGSNAMYFVTICTKNREYYFGEIENGIMVLSEIGEIVKTEWLKTFEMRPDMNLQMGEFVVMPNHFHAVIIIGENEYNTISNANAVNDAVGNGVGDGVGGRDAMHCVSTVAVAVANTVANTDTKRHNQFGPQSKNLASIIRGFKSAVTINARKIHADFAWQPRFHDHIIRNDESFHRISNYIINNPLKWMDDKFCNVTLP